MNTKSPNHGVVRTKKALKSALVSLMKEKSLREITIKEIVAQADYTRGTFYSHYKYKEDLLDEVIEETIHGFIAAFKEPYEGKRHTFEFDKLTHSTVTIFQYISDHSEAFYLFFNKENIGFQEKLSEAIKELFEQEYDFLFTNIPKHINREIYVNQSVFEMLGLISYWVRSNYKYSTQYMTDQMLEIAKLNAFNK